MNTKVLLVDDDLNLLDGVKRTMRKQFDIDTATGGKEGLQRLANDGPYAVVVADMQMPGMTGLEFLRNVQTAAPDAVRVMLTGNADQKTAMDAVNDGRVFRFLTKPCPPPELAPALYAALEQFHVLESERELLENTLGGAVKVLTEILSLFDPATFDRSQQLKNYVGDFVRSSNANVPWELDLAAMLSQIGCVTVPSGFLEKLHKGESLNHSEKELLSQTPEFGARLIENIPRLGTVANIVRYQQKHFDGSGFPADSLTGDEIPIGARIIHVLSDLLDLEGESFSRPEAFQKMQARNGWYDPKVLTAVSSWCDVSLDALADKEEGPPQSLEIDELQVGYVLAQDVRTSEGLMVLAAATKLNAMLVAKLKNFRTLKMIGDTLLVHTWSTRPVTALIAQVRSLLQTQQVRRVTPRL